jgi:hypothetical protein
MKSNGLLSKPLRPARFRSARLRSSIRIAIWRRVVFVSLALSTFAGPGLCVALAFEVSSPPGPPGIASGGDVTNSVVNIYNQDPENIKRLAEVLDRSTQDRAAAEAKAADLARQLNQLKQSNLTAESILGFLRILSRQPDIKTEDVPTKMAEITSQYLSMQKRLAAISEQDSSVADLMRQAASEMDGGRFEVADRFCQRSRQSDLVFRSWAAV